MSLLEGCVGRLREPGCLGPFPIKKKLNQRTSVNAKRLNESVANDLVFNPRRTCLACLYEHPEFVDDNPLEQCCVRHGRRHGTPPSLTSLQRPIEAKL